jgi:UDP-N-acetylglucosamine diphosphorylase/glucosamine-1-phosphate N-acetyltransferase
MTIKEKWEYDFQSSACFLAEKYLQEKFVPHLEDTNLYINGLLLPNPRMVSAVKQLRLGEGLYKNGVLLAVAFSNLSAISELENENLSQIEFTSEISFIHQVADIFNLNGQEIESDFERLSQGRKSATLNATNTLIGNQIFIEEGAKVNAAIINAETGPVYIAKDAEIMEGALIRGPFGLMEHATVKMGAKIYGATTVGPYCKVGGEISNVVFQAYSNKGHDGFLGNSVIGAWCNIGADTNASNLKNNYAPVKAWDYSKKRFLNSGLQFLGLIMGDHSKCGINTMFNTGTVVGICANVFGSGFPRNFVPDFTWGGANSGFTTHQLGKVFETAKIVMERRNQELTEADKSIISKVFEETTQHRYWDEQTMSV